NLARISRRGGRTMKGQLMLVFLASAMLLLTSSVAAWAQEVNGDFDSPAYWRMKSLRVGAAKLRTSLANDPDTVWIGHIADASYVPKDRNGNPLPNSPRGPNGAPLIPGTVPVGGYGPYHVGRGENFPGGDVSQGVAGG